MMNTKARVEKAVFKAIDEMNAHLPKGSAVEKSTDSTLYGRGGKLESLDFVEFIVDVEEKVQEEFGIDFMLTDENLLSKETSPFSTVGSLVEHLVNVIEQDD